MQINLHACIYLLNKGNWNFTLEIGKHTEILGGLGCKGPLRIIFSILLPWSGMSLTR